MKDKYSRVKQDFLNGRCKGCKSYFIDNNNYTEAGYCCLILDDLTGAAEYFKKTKDFDVRAEWGLFLLQMIKQDIQSFPTYLQIRNFLEIDLSILVMYCKSDYISNILKYADFMFFYNPESYKFIGRAFWANKYIDVALFFLEKAKDKFFQDPELHYLLAYIYYEKNDYKLSKHSLANCLEILPEYAPAKSLNKKLTN